MYLYNLQETWYLSKIRHDAPDKYKLWFAILFLKIETVLPVVNKNTSVICKLFLKIETDLGQVGVPLRYIFSFLFSTTQDFGCESSNFSKKCFNVSEFGRSNKCHLHLSGYILNLRPSTFCISVTILSLIDCRIDPIFKEELFSVVNWGAQVSEFISFEVHLKGPTAPIDPLRSLDISLSLKLTFYHKILTGNFLSLWSFFSSSAFD